MDKAITSNEKRAISLVLLGALLLRLYTLGSESFWLDEAIVWHRIKDGPLSFLFDWDADTQGPIYPMMIWVWSKFFGVSEISLRLPSVVFGVLSIHAVYLLGRRLFGHAAAMWASIFAAVNPFLLYYSQEARPYTLWLWASVMAVWYLVRLMESASRVNEIGLIAATLIALYTHPYGPFLLAVLGLIVFTLKPREEWQGFKKSAIIILFAYIPEAVNFLYAFLGKLKNKWSVAAWINTPDYTTPWLYMKYYFAWDKLAAACALALIGGVILYRSRIREVRTGFIVCLAIVAGFFVLPWLVSQFTPILWMRYTISVVAAILLILGWVIVQTTKPLQVITAALLLSGSLFPLYHYYTEYDKDPWRQAVTWLAPQVQAGDKFIVHPARAPMPFEYYFRNLFQHDVAIPIDTTDFAKALPDSGIVWFVAATYSQSKPMRDAAYAILNREGDCDSTYKTSDLYLKNPFRIFSADVEITRCSLPRYAPIGLTPN